MLLVAGTIGIDHIITPHGSKEECIGGSSIHFSYASSVFTPTRIAGIVGNDFPGSFMEKLSKRGIDTSGIEIVEGKTFRWSGRYFDDMDNRETLSTDLNVVENWQPKIPPNWKDSTIVFLANGSPRIQLEILSQTEEPLLTVCDTMDLWINTEREDLEKLLKKVNGVIINESEALLYTEENSLIKAGRVLLDPGPEFIIIKKGAHGSLLFTKESTIALPAYPIESVFDPTGAGDSFAGGFLGYLATQKQWGEKEYKKALAYATCIASFNVEDFGTERLARLETKELEERFSVYKRMLQLD